MRALLPSAAVILAALCFSTTGTAQALAGVDASPLAVGAARILVGGGILGLVALIALGRAAPKPKARAEASLHGLIDRRAAFIVLLGALGVLAYQPAFFLGTRLNGVAIGTVVTLGAAPVVTGILDGLIRRSRPSGRWMLATAIAVVGVVLVSGVASGGGPGSVDPLGVLSSAGAGASYALYTVAGKLLLDRGWGPATAMGSMFGLAAAVSLPLLLAAGAAWLLTPQGAALALWLGVITVAVAYLLFGWGLKRVAATTAATLSLAEPLSASLLGLLLLGEQLAPLAAVGIAVIALGLVVLSVPPRRELPAAP